jgi:hypothetical protein
MADSGQQRKSLIQKSSSDPFKRKSDPEQCAAGLFFRPQLPLVHFHNGSRDGQPHAHAFGLAGEKRFGPALACSPGALLRPPYGLAPNACPGLRRGSRVRRPPPVRRPVPAACSVEVMMARSWSPTLFRKAFHVKGNDDLRWVSLTYALQVF